VTHDYVDWKGWKDADFGYFEHEDALYFSRELDASGINTVSELKVGELGYGNGKFAGWVRKSGGQWVGRDTISELQQRAVKAGFDVIPSDSSFSKACGLGKLDLIVAFDVIEHLELEAIRSFLTDAEAALRKGGKLLIRVPSGDSPFASLIYHADLTHRTLLGSGAARQLAMEEGFEAYQIRSPVLPVWGLGLVRATRRLVVRLLQTLTFSFVRHILMGDANAVLSPNMIVVLRKQEGDR
jgi:SAM-dependent methyltransferase